MDYEKMYKTLFNKVTDVIELLQEAQKQTELMYIESPVLQTLTLMPKYNADDSDLER